MPGLGIEGEERTLGPLGPDARGARRLLATFRRGRSSYRNGSKPFAERMFRLELHGGRQRGVDMEPTLEHHLRSVFLFEQLLHVFEEVLARRTTTFWWNENQRRLASALGLVGLQHARLHHAGQHRGPTALRGFGTIERRVRRRRLRQAGEQSRFCKCQLANRLAKEGSRCRLDAERAVPEVDLVQIELENAILRIPTLEQHRQYGLLELALEALVGRQEEHLRQLLGDGAASFNDAMVPEVLVNGASDPRGIDPVVGVVARVLGGDNRVLELFRDLLERDDDAALDVKLGDQLVVVIVDLGADAGSEALRLRSPEGSELRKHGQHPKRRGARDKAAESDHDQRHRTSHRSHRRPRAPSRFARSDRAIALLLYRVFCGLSGWGGNAPKPSRTPTRESGNADGTRATCGKTSSGEG